jgi:hypothetical protein
MNTRILYLLMIVAASVAASCDSEVWDDLPTPVAKFFTDYFPGQEVSAYSTSDSGSVAQVKNGVTVTFDSGNAWIDVNGNGSTLPDIFLYDQLPEALYRYLQEMEVTAGVYQVSRGDGKYTVELLDTYLYYDIATGAVTYPESGGKTAA